jgi:soluble lytic murein transglycosylase-like protein
VGAIALSSSTPRWPSNVDEPEREPVRADKSTPVAALVRFALTSADPGPMRDDRMAAAAGTPMAPWRSGIFASAEAAPQRFLKALIAANPLQLRSLPPTRLVLAALPDATLDPQSYISPAVRRETPDYSRLAYYAYSEAPPNENPADTVLQALQDIPEGTPVEEVQRAARIFGLDVIFMEAVVRIESNFDPKQRTGSYVGLFQLSKYEFDRYGSGDITDARANAIAGVYKFAVAAILFELATHEKATLPYLYLIHQQGTQGAAEHVAHPERFAWESMCATDEGRLKGERWCKRAIWQNTLPDVKKAWGAVEKLTSAAFVTMWGDRLATLYQRYSASALASASP